MAVRRIEERPVGDGFPSDLASRDGKPAERGITIRAIIIGVVGVFLGVYWGVYGDVVSQTDLTSTSLMMPPVLILITLLVVNSGVRRITPQWVLSQTELITIYVMVTVAVVLSGMGMLQFLCTTLGAVPHYKTPENGWGKYLNDVPHYIMPKLSAIDGFYKGGEPIPWSAWKMPILLWSGFLFLMLFCMMCINSILRKQWMDRERLAYPIAQLPLEMTAPKSSFFRNRLMWAGFLIAAALETTNSLNYLYPNFPYVQLRAYELEQYFTTPPWNSVGMFPITFYPLAIGLGFVLSTDISFSCWFFYLVTKFENVFTAAIGWKGGAGVLSAPPYLAQQGTGAFIGIAVIVIWLARRHLVEVFAKAIGRGREDDSGEPMGYPTAVWGLVGGFVAMVVLCAFMGLSPFIAPAYIGLYLVFATTITRLRAEAGPPWVFGPDLSALDTIVQPIGSSMFSQKALVGMAYFHWFNLEMRCCPMPTHAEGMKMAQATHTRQRAMAVLMLAAMVLGIAFGFYVCLAVWYSNGAETAKVEPWRTMMGRIPFDKVSNYMASQTRPDVSGIMAMTFGAGFTFLLGYLRSKFVWFPFHPAGYVLANTGTMYWLWMPFLIAWICKSLITRYGGIKGYRAALPFFLGLVLGDYVTSSLWALAGSAFKIHMYRCFPC
ncbi:MAG: hypothetical protein Q7T82_03090 [Armatimonadota bacterium]|nr:hypothetical protein [Armatimonadota bacterium]